MSRKLFFMVMLCMLGLSYLAQAQTVTINSNASFGSDGTFTLSGAATTFNDLVVNPAIGKVGANAPDWVVFRGVTDVTVLAFDKTNDETVNFVVQVPHDYKEGSDIFPHVHWTHQDATTTANRVTWRLDYSWANLGDAFPAFSNLSGYETTEGAGANLAQYEHAITSIGTISGSGKKISSIIICKLSRMGSDSNDNFAFDADLLSFDLHYETDAFGSSSAYTK